MSIDPVKIAAPTSNFTGPKKGAEPQKNNRQSFEDVFDKRTNSLKNNDVSQKQLVAQVELAQIKMLQGLFSADDEIDSKDIFSQFFNRGSLAELKLQQSQIADKYSAVQSVSIPESAPRKENQIERMIDQVAEKICLAPELIHSVVAAESDYNPTAVSRAGAQGLMQLMPETAHDLGVKDSFDPMQNLLGGSKYLKQLLDKYDGDLDHALAAYNWGQGNVDRYGLEKIPAETRDYLTKIKSRLGIQAT